MLFPSLPDLGEDLVPEPSHEVEKLQGEGGS